MNIGFDDFLIICNVECEDDFSGFRIKRDGIYVMEHDKAAWRLLTPEEKSILAWHPTGKYDEPALALPCTLEELRAFVAEAGLAGTINEHEVDAMLAKRPDTAPSGTTKKAVPEVMTDDDEQIDAWIIRAREIANDIWLRMLNICQRPTREGIAPEIARRLRESQFVTKTGKRIEAGYIVRSALGKGWAPPKPD